MPQILGKDNSKFEQTIAAQAETDYYRQLAGKIFVTIRRINALTYFLQDDETRKIAHPSQEDINDVMYEFSNGMVPNELLIIVKVGINHNHRLFTDKEIYQIAKVYEVIKEYETGGE